MSTAQRLIFAAVLALAVFFRFHLILEMPGGLFPDEAANGLDAYSIQQGHWQPFYERNNGREALFIYLLWAGHALLGTGPWQLHAVSAAVGVFSTIACFLVARELFLVGATNSDQPTTWRATNIALLAAFLMAVSSWHVVVSRSAFRANLVPLLCSLTFYFLMTCARASAEKRRLLYAALAGGTFALGFYSYPAFWAMIPILGLVVLWPLAATWWQQGRQETLREFRRPLIVFAACFVVVAFPLANYFASHHTSPVRRIDQVSVLNRDFYAPAEKSNAGAPFGSRIVAKVGEMTARTVMAYFSNGDLNWRHNISGEPFLSRLVSPFFGTGTIASAILAALYLCSPIGRSSLWKFFLLSAWFLGMLTPVVLTAERVPHGLRSIGTIPVVFIISAWAIYAAWEILRKALPPQATSAEGGTSATSAQIGWRIAGLCLAAILIGQTYYLYFVYAYRSPENFLAFRSDLTTVSRYLSEKGNREDTYVVLDRAAARTTDFLTTVDGADPKHPRNRPYRAVEPLGVADLVDLKPSDQIIFTQSTLPYAESFRQTHPAAVLGQKAKNQFGETVMVVFKIPP
jgi:hypothetical protein